MRAARSVVACRSGQRRRLSSSVGVKAGIAAEWVLVLAFAGQVPEVLGGLAALRRRRSECRGAISSDWVFRSCAAKQRLEPVALS